jgi:hypothetical protein
MNLDASQRQQIALPAEELACGPGKSFCKTAMNGHWSGDLTTSEGCTVAAYSNDNDSQYNYWQWQPKYANQTSRGNAFLNSSIDTNRFAGRQVRQESFLQGRGQVTSSRNCMAGKLNYLPENQFTPQTTRPLDMSLFAQPSVVPRSCASLTEMNLLDRLAPLPSTPQGIYTPFPADTLPRSDRRLVAEGTTMSSKSYPRFADLKAAQDAMMR